MSSKTLSKTGSQRIIAFDILRGLMLIIMLIDHIELYPSGFDLFTGRGRLFVSAAEGFFFLSGLLVGMIYKRRLHLGLKFVFKKMWLRALELYVLSVFFTLLYAVWAVSANHPQIKYGLPDPVNWGHLIQQTLLLRYGFGWTDFLARFAILMMVAPFVFSFLAKGWWRLLIIISVGVWLFRGQNFSLAWQLMFNGGMVVGFYWSEINGYFSNLSTRTKQVLKKSVYITASVTFLLSYASVYLLSYVNERSWTYSTTIQNVITSANNLNERVWVYAEKWTLGPLRIALFALWFSALFIIINNHAEVINKKSKGLIVLLGQNSLLVYILHSFVVFCFKFVIPVHTNIFQNFGFTLSALICLFSGTYFYRKFRSEHPNINISRLYGSLGSKLKRLPLAIDKT